MHSLKLHVIDRHILPCHFRSSRMRALTRASISSNCGRVGTWNQVRIDGTALGRFIIALHAPLYAVYELRCANESCQYAAGISTEDDTSSPAYGVPFSQPAVVHVQILNRLLDIIDFSHAAPLSLATIMCICPPARHKWSAVKDDLTVAGPAVFLHCPPAHHQ